MSPTRGAPTAQTDWADEVLRFWFTELPRQQWFAGSATLDEQIRSRFLDVHRMVAAAPEDALLADAKTALAAVIVLDQFSRNMFRGTPEAFATDELAAATAQKAIDAGFDKDIESEFLTFLFLPLMHSESIVDQERCVIALHAIAPHNLSYAREHERIIRRFGRFPHRNPILGRHMTPAEQAFIDGGGFAG